MKNYSIIDLEWTSWRNNYLGRFKEIERREKWQKKRNYPNWSYKI
jgi:hypothetical protein